LKQPSHSGSPFERIIANERVVTADELERLRSRRDTGWSIIRRRHVESISVPEDEVSAFSPSGRLAEEFETAMRGADAAADQRFDHAGAAVLKIICLKARSPL
jgi:hypothetical protein